MDARDVGTVIDRHRARLLPSAAAFAERCYAPGLEIYRARLRQYGFGGLGAVLDAGCGFGQWSLALASLVREVEACDVSDVRTELFSDIVRAAGVENVRVTRADVAALPYRDATFDGVFCYGALHLGPWRTMLAELARVLAPGGRLYVNANGFGWYKHLWTTRHNASPDYDPRMLAARALANTCRYDAGEAPEPGLDLLIEPKELHDALERLGFGHIALADEGCLGATDLADARSRAFFRGSYDGDLGVYEVIASGRGGT